MFVFKIIMQLFQNIQHARIQGVAQPARAPSFWNVPKKKEREKEGRKGKKKRKERKKKEKKGKEKNEKKKENKTMRRPGKQACLNTNYMTTTSQGGEALT